MSNSIIYTKIKKLLKKCPNCDTKKDLRITSKNHSLIIYCCQCGLKSDNVYFVPVSGNLLKEAMKAELQIILQAVSLWNKKVLSTILLKSIQNNIYKKEML